MHIVDSAVIKSAMRRRGFRSIQELATAAGLHRNTVHYYLSGHPVLPVKLERLLEQLDLRVEQAIVRADQNEGRGVEQIAPLVDRLHELFPDVTLVLFGSRTRRAHGRHADWDIGAYCRAGLPHEKYRAMRLRVADEVEALPVYVDLVNLNRATPEFLREIAKSWIFLAGRQSDWLPLQAQVTRGR